MGYTPNSDVNVLTKQYSFWRGLILDYTSPELMYVPVPGNHEVQDKLNDKDSTKVATLANENTWRANMGDVIIDSKRWKDIVGSDIAAFDVDNYPGSKDGITSSQSSCPFRSM